MSKPEEIPDTLYPEGNVPMPKAPGLTTIQATAPDSVVSELQAIERCARGRGSPACTAIANRLASVLERIEARRGEAAQPVAWRIVRDDGSQSKWRDLPARKLRPVDGRGARIEFAYPPTVESDTDADPDMRAVQEVTDEMVEIVGKQLWRYWGDVKGSAARTYRNKTRKALEDALDAAAKGVGRG